MVGGGSTKPKITNTKKAKNTKTNHSSINFGTARKSLVVLNLSETQEKLHTLPRVLLCLREGSALSVPRSCLSWHTLQGFDVGGAVWLDADLDVATTGLRTDLDPRDAPQTVPWLCRGSRSRLHSIAGPASAPGPQAFEALVACWITLWLTCYTKTCPPEPARFHKP